MTRHGGRGGAQHDPSDRIFFRTTQDRRGARVRRDARAATATSGWSALRADRWTTWRGRSRPRAGATIGLHRFSLTQLAARLARAGARGAGAGAGDLPRFRSGRRARDVRRAARRGARTTSRRSRRPPGFPRALARTLQELRLAGVDAGSSRPIFRSAAGSRRPARAIRRAVRQRQRHRSRDAVRGGDARRFDELPASGFQLPAAVLLLDVPIDSAVEFEFVRALLALTHSTHSSTRAL